MLVRPLAIRGQGGKDIYPGVEQACPPLLAVADRLWDGRIDVRKFVSAWRQARRDLERYGSRWSWVRRPVGAAFAMLHKIVAIWKTPFEVELLGQGVSLKEVPPLQVRQILRAHARRELGRDMIRRMVQENGWVIEVINTYWDGVDWALLRKALVGEVWGLAHAARSALRVVAVGGFWPEERRWRAGLPGVGHGTCSACYAAMALESIGCIRVALCNADWWRLVGRTSCRPASSESQKRH